MLKGKKKKQTNKQQKTQPKKTKQKLEPNYDMTYVLELLDDLK